LLDPNSSFSESFFSRRKKEEKKKEKKIGTDERKECSNKIRFVPTAEPDLHRSKTILLFLFKLRFFLKSFLQMSSNKTESADKLDLSLQMKPNQKLASL
jgi:hypothetical protein